MSPALATSEKVVMISSEDDPQENIYKKGVKHMYDNGVEHVPHKYIWPVEERPNVVSGKKTCIVSPPAADDCDLKLPIIDFMDLQGPKRSQVLESLAHACEEYGFFQLVNHGISKDVISNMVSASKEFFEQPITEREKYMSADLNSIVRYGTSFNQTNDGVFSWRDFLKLLCSPMPDVLSHWPSSPQHFREKAATYAQETKQLFLTLSEAILESLMMQCNKTNKTTREETLQDGDEEIRKILKELENGSQLMIANCFPPCPEPDLTLGMPPHSDYGFLTLVLQDEVKGLQIQHRQRWLTVHPMPASFVVNVGDHLEIFSNGRYKSVLHRVLVNAARHRTSVASLHSLPFTSTVRPWTLLIDEETNPRRYKDTDFTNFLDYIKSCDSKKKNFLETRKMKNVSITSI